MKFLIKHITLSLGCFMLLSCGQAGKLYLPNTTPPSQNPFQLENN